MLTVKTRKFILCWINLLYLILFAFWSIDQWSRTDVVQYENLVFPWIVAALIIQVSSFAFMQISYVELGFLMLIFSHLFMFGYVYMEGLGLSTVLLWNPVSYFTEQELLHAAIYVNFCMEFFLLFYISFYKKGRENNLTLHYDTVKRLGVKNTGMLLLLIGFSASFLKNYRLIKTTLLAGSYTAYTQASAIGIADDLAYLLVPGVLYLICSGMLSNKKKYVYAGIILFYMVLIMMLSGSRKDQIFSILSIVLCLLWDQNKKKAKGKSIFLTGIGGVFFLNIIYVIREYRMDLPQIIPGFVNSIKSMDFLGNILGETMAETGITFCAVAAVLHCVPWHTPFQYGVTILRTIPSFLPIGWLVGDFFNLANSTFVINTITKLPVGASLLGDFYWNWGFAGGVLASCGLGYIFAKLVSKFLYEKNRPEIYFSILYAVMPGVRAGIFELYRPLILVTLIPFAVEKIILFQKRGMRKQ